MYKRREQWCVNYPERCIKLHLSPTTSCLLTTEGERHEDLKPRHLLPGLRNIPQGLIFSGVSCNSQLNVAVSLLVMSQPSAELHSSKPFQSEVCEGLLFGNRSRHGHKTMSGDTGLDRLQSMNRIGRKYYPIDASTLVAGRFSAESVSSDDHGQPS